MPKTIPMILALAAAAAAAQTAGAAPITSSNDTTVTRGDGSATNNGLATTVQVRDDNRANSTANEQVGAIRFDLSSISPRSSAGSSLALSVRSSGLTTSTATSTTFTFDLYGVLDGINEDNLVETSFTRGDVQAIDFTSNYVQDTSVFDPVPGGGAQPIASITLATLPAANSTLTFSGGFFDNFLNSAVFNNAADNDAAFIVTLTATGTDAAGAAVLLNANTAFDSRNFTRTDGGFVPTLNVVPEPSAAFALLAAGGLGLMRRRRS